MWQVAVAVCMLLIAGSGVAGIFVGQAWLFIAAVVVLLGTTVGSLSMIRWIERTLLPTEETPIVKRPLQSLCAIAITNIAMVRVVFVSLLTRVISWRGIVYRIEGPWRIKMLEYHPFVDEVAVPTELSAPSSELDLTGAKSVR